MRLSNNSKDIVIPMKNTLFSYINHSWTIDNFHITSNAKEKKCLSFITP
ncbi:hypothetical protein XBP1_520014 [Xenorhabdus bovienii str. puntauvense]|uniref:Uncharacterized protein n=2 Tax=Xenorhabdus bovienii TaxID=40576 RepID=A0A0B6XBV2_XENBV|nr:hypothetical protein XBFFR1_1350017 [Xenorhabdus bovienii str. feltiae France]CDG92790.1 hypothetical protein XBFFL1_2310017 [Xenorhabdus bovienii str. feltiae Florida]CDG98737.1 hypothetical protein XBP1_520014 [Xenorhabdus bovienii str. puntauvense]CDM91307.1 protein of unknown function [Xenorhabdus bovienii]